VRVRALPRWMVGAALLMVAISVGVVLVVRGATSPPAVTAKPPPVVDISGRSGVTIMAAGDIAEDGSEEANAAATAALVRAGHPDAVLTLGDNAYDNGSSSDYAAKYAPTWGSFEARTHPVPGNHDYESGQPTGYVGYFGRARVTNPVDGGVYYAWNAGRAWRAYAVNTEISTSGAQLTWLRKDVAAHPNRHYLLYTHHPRYTSGVVHSPDKAICPLWNALAATGRLEIVLAGHQHDYERFAKMDCAGHLSPSGARSFVVGSGGNDLYAIGTPQPGSQFRNDTDYGVLRLVLHRNSYSWAFFASGRGWDGSFSVDTGKAGRVLDSGVQLTRPRTGG
jgi:hypothetical protein